MIVKRVKGVSCDGVRMIMNTFHEGILVKIFNKGLDVLKKVVFSIWA